MLCSSLHKEHTKSNSKPDISKETICLSSLNLLWVCFVLPIVSAKPAIKRRFKLSSTNSGTILLILAVIATIISGIDYFIKNKAAISMK